MPKCTVHTIARPSSKTGFFIEIDGSPSCQYDYSLLEKIAILGVIGSVCVFRFKHFFDISVTFFLAKDARGYLVWTLLDIFFLSSAIAFKVHTGRPANF